MRPVFEKSMQPNSILGIDMYGVVLWSDKEDSKAVIWCEDHGDLAFYDGASDCALDGCTLDAGDLVKFILSEDRDMRLATNPRLVAEQQYPGLADSLLTKGDCPATAHAHAQKSGADACNVIPFTPRNEHPRLAS